MIFFKYMSLEKLERFVDILINQHLYAACYRDLNDPFEGCFDWKSLDKEVKEEFFRTMYNARICSLQGAKEEDVPSNTLMWSHYANSHKGCCLKVRIDNVKNWKKCPMNYSEILQKPNKLNIRESVEEILSHKTKEWSYENEVRFVRFVENRKKVYIPVRIESVYLGVGMSAEEKKIYAKLVNKIDSSIMVYKMKKQSDREFYLDLETELISK